MTVQATIATPAVRRAAQPEPAGTVANPWAKIVAEGLGVVIYALLTMATLGPVVVVLVPAATIVLLIIARREIAINLRMFAMLAFPLFCFLSLAWTPDPSVNARYAIQLLITVVAAIAVPAAIGPRGFLRVLFLSALISLLLVFPSGITNPSANGPIRVGYMGSKNFMASCAHLLLLSGLCIAADWRQWWALRLLAVGSMPLALYMIATSSAATTIILTVLIFPFYAAVLLMSRLPYQFRLPAIILVAFATLTMGTVAVSEQAALEDFVFTTFHKDPSLTGRTYLWNVAAEQIAQKPLVGAGYRYVWTSYSAPAVGMLRSMNLVDVRGFSMHETYLEAAVDVGYFGLAILVSTMAIGVMFAGSRAIFEGGDQPMIFTFLFLLTLVVRSFGETLYAPFAMGGAILLALCAQAMFGREA